MRMVSTLKSSHRGEISLLALAETCAAVGISLWVVIGYDFIWHIAASCIFALPLLLRTRRSDRLCQLWVSRLIGNTVAALSSLADWHMAADDNPRYGRVIRAFNPVVAIALP